MSDTAPTTGVEDPTVYRTGVVLLMGNGVWAIGDTLAEARKNFTSYGGRLSQGYGIIRYDDTTEFRGVDELGRYHWKGNEPTVEMREARK